MLAGALLYLISADANLAKEYISSEVDILECRVNATVIFLVLSTSRHIIVFDCRAAAAKIADVFSIKVLDVACARRRTFGGRKIQWK